MAAYPAPISYFVQSPHCEALVDRFGEHLESLTIGEKSLLIAALACLQYFRRIDPQIELSDIAVELNENEPMPFGVQESCRILEGIPSRHAAPLLQFMLQ